MQVEKLQKTHRRDVQATPQVKATPTVDDLPPHPLYQAMSSRDPKAMPVHPLLATAHSKKPPRHPLVPTASDEEDTPTPSASNSLKKPSGLSLLVEQCLGRPLDKCQQLSDWERRPLREEQVRYAGK